MFEKIWLNLFMEFLKLFYICFVFIKVICIFDGESVLNLLLLIKVGKVVNNKLIMVWIKVDGGFSFVLRKGNIIYVLYERI